MAQETKAEKAAREAAEAEAAAAAEAAVNAAAQGVDVDGDADAERKPGGRVKVAQPDGEITFSRGGEVVLSKTVVDGHVEADDDAELAVLLGSVPGAELVEG